jgi:type IV secretion system protein TrbL
MTRQRLRVWCVWAYLGLILLFLMAPVVHAQTNSLPQVPSGDEQVFGNAGPSTIVNDYLSATSGWLSTMAGVAHTLFWSLATIDFCWTAISLALRGVDFQQWVAGFIKKVITIGFFAALLDNGPAWTQWIVNFFVNLGSQAGGTPTSALSASAIMGNGVDIAGAMLGGAAGAAQNTMGAGNGVLGGVTAGITGAVGLMVHFAPTMCLVLGALVVVFAFVIIACHFVMAMVEAYVVLGAGYVFLGFGGSRWTVPYVEKYIGLLISAGVRIMVLELMIGLGQTLSQQWITQAQNIAQVPDIFSGGSVSGTWIGVQSEFGLVGSILLYGILCWTIPQIASNVIGGSLSMSGVDPIGPGMATAGAAAAGAGAVASWGGGSKSATTVSEVTQAAGMGMASSGVKSAITAAAVGATVATGGAAAPVAGASAVGGGSAAIGGGGAAAASATPAVPASALGGGAAAGAGTPAAPGAMAGAGSSFGGGEGVAATGSSGSSSGASGSPRMPSGSNVGGLDSGVDSSKSEPGTPGSESGSAGGGDEAASSQGAATPTVGLADEAESAAATPPAPSSAPGTQTTNGKGVLDHAQSAVKHGQNVLRSMPGGGTKVGGSTPNMGHGEE